MQEYLKGCTDRNGLPKLDWAEWDELLAQITLHFRERRPTVDISYLKRGEERTEVARQPIIVSEVPGVTKISTLDRDGEQPWEFGEYELVLRSRSGQTIFSDVFTVIDQDLCVLRAIVLLSQPEYTPRNEKWVAIDVADLIRDVCYRRQSRLRLLARTIDFEIDELPSVQIRAAREQLTVDIETLLAHAEAVLFHSGKIQVKLLRDCEPKASIGIEILIPYGNGCVVLQRRGILEDLILTHPERMLTGCADVERGGRTAELRITYQYNSPGATSRSS